MRIDVEIIALENNGDEVRVTAQGHGQREATWRRYHKWTFTVPEYVGSRYRLGQKLRITVKAQR